MLLLKRKKTVSMRLKNVIAQTVVVVLFFENKKTTEMSIVESEKEKQSITLSGSTSSSSSTLRKKDTFPFFVQNIPTTSRYIDQQLPILNCDRHQVTWVCFLNQQDLNS